MNDATTATAGSKQSPLPGLIVWVSTLAGLGLSIEALLTICGSCSVTAGYRLFGMEFGWAGIAFFAPLLPLLALRRRQAWCGWLVPLLLFAAAGAEARFIWIQKYEIGQWCPICLCLAAAVFLACLGSLWERLHTLSAKGESMKSTLVTLLLASFFFVIGLGAATVGVNKQADAAEPDLFLGRRSSPTTVYFVSDWFCPACRKAEPTLERIYPELSRSVRIGFVDFPIHRETTNFTPYNMQFLINEKAKYMSLRRALSELSLKTRTPSEAEVAAAIAPLGVRLRPINYADTLNGMQWNQKIYNGFNVHSTPTVVVTNGTTSRTKLLVGGNRISLPAIRAAIADVESN